MITTHEYYTYYTDKPSANWLNYINSYIKNKRNRLNNREFGIRYELNLTVDIVKKHTFSNSTREYNTCNV